MSQDTIRIATYTGPVRNWDSSISNGRSSKSSSAPTTSVASRSVASLYRLELFRIGGKNLFEEFITALPEEFRRRLCLEDDLFVVWCLH